MKRQKTLTNKILPRWAQRGFTIKPRPKLAGIGEREIFNIFKKHGYITIHSGFPDLLLIKDEKFRWLEIKKSKKHAIRASQLNTFKALTLCGMEVDIFFVEDQNITPFYSNYNIDDKLKSKQTPSNRFLSHNIPNRRIPKEILVILNELYGMIHY